MRYAVILKRNNVWHWEGSSISDARDMFELVRRSGTPAVLAKIVEDSEHPQTNRADVPNIFEPAKVS